LSLSLGDHPVLNAYPDIGVRIGPARYVSGGKDTADAGLEEFVDGEAIVDGETRRLGQSQVRPYANSGDDNVGVEPRAIVENDDPVLNRFSGSLKMEVDTLLLVNTLYQGSELRSKHAFQWQLLG